MKAPALNLNRANRANVAPGLLALGLASVLLATIRTHGEALDERESTAARQEAKFRVISNAHTATPATQRMAELMAQQRYAAEPARAHRRRLESEHRAALGGYRHRPTADRHAVRDAHRAGSDLLRGLAAGAARHRKRVDQAAGREARAAGGIRGNDAADYVAAFRRAARRDCVGGRASGHREFLRVSSFIGGSNLSGRSGARPAAVGRPLERGAPMNRWLWELRRAQWRLASSDCSRCSSSVRLR